MQDIPGNIIVVMIFTTLLMIVLVAFIVSIFYLYQKRQILYYKNIEQLKLEYDNNILSAQLEMQENTFSNISQEIHDNIGLSLTLAKLNLNSIEVKETNKYQTLVQNSSELISKAISDLSDLSRSFNAEVIISQGLISSLQIEIARIQKGLKYHVDCRVLGEPYYLESKKEILLFRIFQESINNVIKHAFAKTVMVQLQYFEEKVIFTIGDDGKGFDEKQIQTTKKSQAGLKNILKRASLMDANVTINSELNRGTQIEITIPTNTSKS